MAHLSTSEQFCTHCGAPASTVEQRFCTKCGVKILARESFSEEKGHSQDATVRVSDRGAIRRRTVDRDATVRVDTRRQRTSRDDSIVRLNFRSDSYQKVTQPFIAPLQLSQQREVQKHELFSHQKKSKQRKSNNAFLKKKALVKVLCGVGLVLTLMFLGYGASNLGGDARLQQQSNRDKARLDALLQNALALGVPTYQLRPLLEQEQRLSRSQPSLTLFSNRQVYYQELSKQYRSLQSQVPQIIINTTEQFQLQAERDMQNFQTALSEEASQGFVNSHYLSQQFSQDQLLLASARTLKDYSAISSNARSSMQLLQGMESTFKQLADLKDTIVRMKGAHVDTTAIEAQYQNDVQTFNNNTTPSAMQNLSTQIDAQYQQVIVGSVQAFPYVSVTKLNELATQIHLLQTYGGDATAYQARLNADQVAVEHAQTVYDDLVFFRQVDGDIASMSDDLLHGQAHYLVKQFHQEVDSWAKAHPYNDNSDGHQYALDNGYMKAGIGATLDGDLASATTSADFEAMVAEANNALFNLHMLEADYSDSTPYNQLHATDVQMLNHYQLQKKQVLMISLVEQAMRIYQNGQLVNSYHVTTGRQELPSLPGVWSVLDRRSPTIFKAADPKGSPYWFPDTPISYAILYHWGGYYVHDAPWRADFGPGTQFPHQDSGGTTAYNFDGSHGCINLQESDATWVYKHTNWNSIIVIY